MRVLIQWAGDDPDREGLMETPARVARSYRERDVRRLRGRSPRAYMERTFEEVGGYDELVVLRDIPVVQLLRASHAAGAGQGARGLPADQPGGRDLETGARRSGLRPGALQIQEKLTAEIAGAIDGVLKPKGVGVVIEAEHSCMTLRGVNTPGASLTTSHLTGVIRDDARTRQEFLRLARGH